jgi:hypothetical protein
MPLFITILTSSLSNQRDKRAKPGNRLAKCCLCPLQNEVSVTLHAAFLCTYSYSILVSLFRLQNLEEYAGFPARGQCISGRVLRSAISTQVFLVLLRCFPKFVESVDPQISFQNYEFTIYQKIKILWPFPL